jgi:methylmalonyl-CoA mutase C-terminal domain/subunit
MSQDAGLTRSVTRVLLVQLGRNGGDDFAQSTAKALARSLRALGLDVVYGGHQGSPGNIVQAAMQEDVDVVGIQLGSGNASGVADETGGQLPGIKVVELPQGMTAEEAVTAIQEAGTAERRTGKQQEAGTAERRTGKQQEAGIETGGGDD